MSKNNVRIAIRDATDSHNVAFFDNKAGIKYKSAKLQRFLAGSASILTLKYNSKDIDSIRSGCKLAFRYKNRDYWLNVMNFEKKGYEVELIAYSLGLELNNETRGEHKPANAMSIAEYVAYYDPEHALTIGVNEVSDKRIKLEWTGTDTILARLFSVANSFDAELDFNVELNDDYSLKRQVLNIYKKGNLGTNKVSHPVRVGKELKVINYSDNIKELRTAVRATGKDGLTIDGLNKKIYDNNKELLYYSSGMTVYAPQSRDRFPSVGKGSNDNWIVEDLGETQYETKEALWAYLYGEIQKKSLPEITYEVEGAIDAGIGDTQTLIDDIHFEPALYVRARVSELEDDLLTGKVTKSTFINFERKYSQIADELQKQVNELVQSSTPYEIKVSSDNGTVFKNATGTSTFKAKLFKGEKEITTGVSFIWSFDGVDTPNVQYTARADKIDGTAVLIASAYIGNNEVATTEITLTNVNDGVQGKTSYIHFAYADDNKGTNLSFTDKNQQYQGYYTDYDEVASLDYKKYTWVDRLANVNVGGTNLIKGTADFSGGWAWNTGVASTTDIIDKFNVYHCVSNGSSSYYDLKFNNALDVLPDTEYTMSFWVKGNGAILSYFYPKNVAYGVNSDGKRTTQLDGSITHTLKGEWEKYWVTWKTKNTASGLKNIIPCRLMNDVKSEVWLYGVKFEKGNIPTDWTPAPEDYDSKLATTKSEIKQTTEAISASVSALDETTVKSSTLNLDNNGFVTKVDKVVDGNKFATMIAQDAENVKIIADKMQVNADMIVDGAVTADKLNVDNLSAINSNLGKIKGGSVSLQQNKPAGHSIDNWGSYDVPAYKQGLFVDDYGIITSGAIRRKNGTETVPTDMPIAVLQSGELRFLSVDYNENLENVLHYGLSDPDFGAIRFENDKELKRRLTLMSSGYLNFTATNYTEWKSTGVAGCEFKIQGSIVFVNYDITFSTAGTHTIGGIPQEFTKKALMMTAKAWSLDRSKDRNVQLNPDGGIHILNAEANVNYRGTLVFSY